VNPNILIFAEGIGNKSASGGLNNPNWGENLFEGDTNPPTMPKTKLVYEPHCYGPSVATQGFFADTTAQPNCATLLEDAFGDAKCQIVINPAKLEPSWQAHFGKLKAAGYAVCIGEFGGNMDWPNKAETRMQTRYSYLTDKTSDMEWQNAFVNYLLKAGVTDTIYWSINPESSDTYGLYTTPYDPISNTGGWGTWTSTDSKKLTLLQKLWNAPSSTPISTTMPTPTPTSSINPTSLGDANGDGSVTIVDALLVAQYSVGLSVTINLANADVNGDGSVNIVDALRIAQLSVGLP
jgi:endoglucanase